MLFEQILRLSAPPETVWLLAADTDRLNREIGLPPVHFTFGSHPLGGSEVTACMAFAGVRVRYREHPFNWVRPRFHTVKRTFFGGPIDWVEGGVELRPMAGGATEARVHAWFEPRGPMGLLACRAAGPKMVADCARGLRGFEAWLAKRARTPYPRHSGRPPANRERLSAALERLERAGTDPAMVRRMGEFLAAAPPEDVALIRPHALADRWGAERRAVLEACLQAARGGLLELRWRVLCPYCRGGPVGVRSLRDLAETVHCSTCNIRFDADFDQRVEVCFRVAPAIRAAEETAYCIGGPMLSPHVAAQWTLAPGASARTEVPLLPGDYRLTTPQGGRELAVRAVAGGDAPAVTVSRAGHAVEFLAAPPEAGTDSVWELVNHTDCEVVVRLESPAWSADSATAAMVTSLQAFRDLFSSEVLSPGLELAVRQICVLFSDLKGSTDMYRQRGDAASYRAVRDHFDRLREVIERHTGAILKTAGDAVMAVFSDPADALAAALAVQRQAQENPDGLVVKIGLHWGPAIAVNANNTLDYFGQTVNIAARLQGESAGGDVVIAQEVSGDPRVADILQSNWICAEPFESELRGLGRTLEMIRLTVASVDGYNSVAAEGPPAPITDRNRETTAP